MGRADWALLFSALSLTIAVGALFWQMFEWRASGGRVHVELGLAEIVPYAGTSMLKTHSHKRKRRSINPKFQSEPGMEVARVVVENRGRLPVSVSGVGLDFRAKGSKLYRVTPRIFEMDGLSSGEGTVDTAPRLEPFSRVTLLFDLWAPVDSFVADRPGVTVTAYADVVGRSRSSLSRVRWWIPAQDVCSRQPTDKLPMRDLVLRVLMRDGWKQEPYSHIMDSSFAMHAAKKLEPTMTREDVHAVLTETAAWFGFGEPPPMSYMSLVIHQWMTDRADSLLWQYEAPAATDDAQPAT